MHIGPSAPTPSLGAPIIGVRPLGATAAPGVYQGGTYGQLDAEPVSSPLPGATQAATAPAVPPVPPVARNRGAGTVYGGQTGRPTSANSDAPIEMSGSLTGLILSRGQSQAQRKRERRQRLKTALWVTLGFTLFVGAIALVVWVLAGDFIRSLFTTLSGLA